MQLAKALLEAGVFSGEPLTSELDEKIKQVLRREEPPLDMRNGRELTVVCHRSAFYIYDFDGYLGTTKSIEMVAILFMLTETKSGPRQALGLSVKRMQANIPAEGLEAIMARAQALRDGYESKESHVRGSAGYGDEMGDTTYHSGPIRQIGVSDGSPKFEV